MEGVRSVKIGKRSRRSSHFRTYTKYFFLFARSKNIFRSFLLLLFSFFPLPFSLFFLCLSFIFFFSLFFSSSFFSFPHSFFFGVSPIVFFCFFLHWVMPGLKPPPPSTSNFHQNAPALWPRCRFYWRRRQTWRWEDADTANKTNKLRKNARDTVTAC